MRHSLHIQMKVLYLWWWWWWWW